MGMDAVDIYGLSEVMGPGVANECVETKDGPTIWEDHFYPEIIDPDTGEPVADGEFGELVFTSLTKEALPIIRYRTRDLTRLLPGTARTMRRMEKITGRSDDMMIVRGVNVFPTQIEELILRRAELAPHYQCILTREGPLDALTVAVETRHDVAHDRRRPRPRRERLAHEIKAYIGTSARIELRACRRHRAQPGQGEAGAGPAQVVGAAPQRHATMSFDRGTAHWLARQRCSIFSTIRST